MGKRTVLSTVAAAIVIAYGGGTWWTGQQMAARYDAALTELSAQRSIVRVIDHHYERGFFGATSTLTLEVGCAFGAPAGAASPTQSPDEEADGEPAEAAKPIEPLRFTVRNTIHHGPLAGGTLAAATIDSELVLEPKAQAEAKKFFGDAQPATAHTRIAFAGAIATELVFAPGKLSDPDKGDLVWQGARLRMAVDGARTRASYDLSLPGSSFSDAARGVRVSVGPITSQADMAIGAGWLLATGTTQARLDSLVFDMSAGTGPAAEKALDLKLQGIDMAGQATLKDGLLGSTGTVTGSGQLGSTPLKFELSTFARGLEASGYQKVTETWMKSNLGNGCNAPDNQETVRALTALVEQLAPDLKAMARFEPAMGIDKLIVDIGDQRGEASYSVGVAGVTNEDVQGPGTQLLLKRGVLKASARVPQSWLEQIAATGADQGVTPPAEMVAGLLEQSEAKGMVQRLGEDVVAQIEFSDGRLKINGKPFGPARK